MKTTNVRASGYLEVAGHKYSEARARAVIAGYALATDEARLTPDGVCQEMAQGSHLVPRWGYRTYDCVAPSPGPHCEAVDYLVAAGLNGRIDVASVGALQQVCPAAFDELSRVDEEVTFWELNRYRLLSPPVEPCPERHLWSAWCRMMSMPEIGVALTHKTLHHKRPRLFPMVDGRTVNAFRKDAAWATIHEDLNQANGQPFAALEEWFAALIHGQEGCIPLTRLRLHDILLWCRIMPGEEEDAAQRGQVFL